MTEEQFEKTVLKHCDFADHVFVVAIDKDQAVKCKVGCFPRNACGIGNYVYGAETLMDVVYQMIDRGEGQNGESDVEKTAAINLIVSYGMGRLSKPEKLELFGMIYERFTNDFSKETLMGEIEFNKFWETE